MKRFGWLDIVTIVLAVASCAFTLPAVVRNLTTPPLRPNVPTLFAGTRFDLPGIELHRPRGTMAIVVDTPCLECSPNIAAYNSLIETAENRGIQVLLIAPRASVLADLGIHGASAKSLVRSPRELGLGRVPSVVWLSDDGTLVQRWQGVLSVTSRRQIEDILHQQPVPPPLLNGDISRDLLARLVEDRNLQSRLLFLDVRNRREFAKDHRDGSLNIPFDELSMRIRHEVDPGSVVIIDCKSITAYECDLSKRVFEGEGYRSVASVDRTANRPELCAKDDDDDSVVAVLNRP